MWQTQILHFYQTPFPIYFSIMPLLSDGYICITYANGILQWREGIAYIFRMGGLSGVLNHYFY